MSHDALSAADGVTVAALARSAPTMIDVRPLLIAVAALVVAPVPAVARDVGSVPGVEIVGAKAADGAGAAVAAAGDVNGDGIDDVIVGAPQADAPGRPDAGAAYVIFGRRPRARARTARTGRSPLVRIAMESPAQGFRILGPAAHASAGAAVAGAGDVNHDGLADLVIGAPGTHWSRLLASGRGSVFIVYGRHGGAPVDLHDLGAGGVRIDGVRGEAGFGSSVAAGKDVNGDGTPDVIATDHGAPFYERPGHKITTTPPSHAWVVFGAGLSAGRTSVAALGDRGFAISPGGVVSLVDDMNGDGRAELVMSTGDELVTENGGPARREAHVVFGRAETTPVDLAGVGASGGFVLGDRGGPGYHFAQVKGGGDVNGDGLGDLIVTNWFGLDPKGNWLPGRATVVFGSASTDTVWLQTPSPRLVTMFGPPQHQAPVFIDPASWVGGSLGASAAIVGDLDGDGLDDVLIGAERDPHTSGDTGAAYLVPGRRDATTLTLDASALRVDGAQPGDAFGGDAGPAGDFDGDGHPDLLVGAFHGTRAGRARAGVAWILTGLEP